ncbi:fumarylacetoacetate hydrolase family protein, partial [Mycobacterium tuberculosis]
SNFGLGPGDLIFTGTPAGVAALRDGDRLQTFWGEEKLGECTVSLKA